MPCPPLLGGSRQPAVLHVVSAWTTRASNSNHGIRGRESLPDHYLLPTKHDGQIWRASSGNSYLSVYASNADRVVGVFGGFVSSIRSFPPDASMGQGDERFTVLSCQAHHGITLHPSADSREMVAVLLWSCFVLLVASPGLSVDSVDGACCYCCCYCHSFFHCWCWCWCWCVCILLLCCVMFGVASGRISVSIAACVDCAASYPHDIFRFLQRPPSQVLDALQAAGVLVLGGPRAMGLGLVTQASPGFKTEYGEAGSTSLVVVRIPVYLGFVSCSRRPRALQIAQCFAEHLLFSSSLPSPVGDLMLCGLYGLEGFSQRYAVCLSGGHAACVILTPKMLE